MKIVQKITCKFFFTINIYFLILIFVLSCEEKSNIEQPEIKNYKNIKAFYKDVSIEKDDWLLIDFLKWIKGICGRNKKEYVKSINCKDFNFKTLKPEGIIKNKPEGDYWKIYYNNGDEILKVDRYSKTGYNIEMFVCETGSYYWIKPIYFFDFAHKKKMFEVNGKIIISILTRRIYFFGFIDPTNTAIPINFSSFMELDENLEVIFLILFSTDIEGNTADELIKYSKDSTLNEVVCKKYKLPGKILVGKNFKLAKIFELAQLKIENLEFKEETRESLDEWLSKDQNIYPRWIDEAFGGDFNYHRIK